MASEDVYEGVQRLVKPDGGCVYLLGTSHCSNHSAAQASALVKAVVPTAVAIELCESRRHMLSPPATAVPPPKAPAATEDEHSAASVVDSLSALMADWTEVIELQYAGIERLAGDDITGNEFREASVAALGLGATVLLADSDCGLTQRRLKLLVPTSELVWSLLWEDPQWTRDQAYARMERAHRLQQMSSELATAAASAARGEPSAAVECARLSGSFKARTSPPRDCAPQPEQAKPAALSSTL